MRGIVIERFVVGDIRHRRGRGNVLADSYLMIARSVLEKARRPLSAREILAHAYEDQCVPDHLYGRTQHKTLQARLSEDILIRRNRSEFFRTAPGRFFLRRFLADSSIPDKYRRPIVARRRTRQLIDKHVLVVDLDGIELKENKSISSHDVFSVLDRNAFRYTSIGARIGRNEARVWSFAIVTRGHDVLSYRRGQYREQRENFLQKRCIGFFTPVTEDDWGLFNFNDLGILSSGVRAAAIDLDIPDEFFSSGSGMEAATLNCFLPHRTEDQSLSLVAVLSLRCPEWYEPTKRRLALNDLKWLDIDRPPNHIEDFDPWSQLALVCARTEIVEHSG